MFRCSFFLMLLAMPAFAQTPNAVEKLPAGAKVLKLTAHPAKIELRSPFAYSQLLITAQLEGGETADVTRIATLNLPQGIVSASPNGQVRVVADGTGKITASLAGKSVAIPVKVVGAKSPEPVSFVRDVQPAPARADGAQAGKNGFKLSLRGYDPIFDHRALTDDIEGRRFNRAAPERSLMLLKTSGAIPHAGGVLTSPGEPSYELLRRWVAEGVKLDLDAVRVRSLEIFPKSPTVPRIGMKQQFAVLATYADSSVRDVTGEAFIDSSNTEVATVDKTGLLTAVRRGESTLLARYEGSYAASTAVVMGDRSGFLWAAPPQFNWIDELVDKKLKRVRVLPSPVCDDAEFVRRLYLDLTGMPPTPEVVAAFLADRRNDQSKRDELINRLVGSEPFIEQWTNKWADMLQVNRKWLGDAGAAALRKWVRAAVAKNEPYNKLAYEVLTASGSNVANPPASYFKVLRDASAVMENTTQLFLAVRFNCNKCHDHPFERWTQDQYYQMAAFFAQVDRKEDPKFKGQKLGGTAVEKALPLAEVIEDAKTGDIKHDRTGEVTAPKFPFEIKGPIPAEAARRVRAAKWITDPTNPYFARSYVNRVWSYLLGVGLIEPVDDIRAGNPPSNPELLDRLTAEFVAEGFDTRKLITLICQSRTYQLSITTNKWNKDDDLNYSHATPRRLSAEMLYDAVHAVTGATSKLPGLPPGSRAAQLVDSNVELPGGFLELFGKPARESACECERSNGMNLGPVLAMVNGPIVAQAIKDPNNRIAKIVASTPDDAKAVEAIYLSVVNRLPSATETEDGVRALRSAKADLAALVADNRKKKETFSAYEADLDAKQKAWEEGLRTQKPTEWTVLAVQKAESRAGSTLAEAEARKEGAVLTIEKDGTVKASGRIEAVDVYTITGQVKLKRPLTALRLEALADAALPGKGPGRAESGNFVINEISVSQRPADAPTEKPKPMKLSDPVASFEQAGFPVRNAIDKNQATGWAISGGTGRDQKALFRLRPATAANKSVLLTVVIEQRFGSGHSLGKFRLSVTDDKTPRLLSALTPEQAALLDPPSGVRTAEQKTKLRQMYLAQDQEYHRLKQLAAEAPPTDARLLGAQDLVWALINSPAFLFNH